MKIRFKKLRPEALTPEYKTEGAAAFDLACAERTVAEPGKATLVPLGVAIEIPEHHVGMLYCRSSLPPKKGLFVPNGAGVIDSDYRGEWFLCVAPLGQEAVVIEAGERIAQVVVTPCRQLLEGSTVQGFVEVQDLTETARGAGGFGSTGTR